MKNDMTVADAQREVRSVYLNGAVGSAVSGAIWLASAVAAHLAGVREAVLIAVIFPLTQLALRLAGRRASLSRENPFAALAMQVAFIVPLTLPVAGGAALYRIEWFYPAVMVIVGAHYLPFVFLYGMRSYGVLAAALIAGGIALRNSDSFVVGGWATGAVLTAFAVWAAIGYSGERGREGEGEGNGGGTAAAVGAGV